MALKPFYDVKAVQGLFIQNSKEIIVESSIPASKDHHVTQSKVGVRVTLTLLYVT